MKTTPTVTYRIVTGEAGVSWSRRSTPFDNFGDANRAAMEACVKRNRPVQVYAYGSDPYTADLVAEYIPVNGRAQSVPV